MKYSQEEKAQARETLENCFPKGSTVFGITRTISRTGTSRVISVLSIQNGGTSQNGPSVMHPNWAVSVLTGRRLKRGGMNGGIVSGGCGFDHLESIARDIERALGYKVDALHYELL